MANRRQRKQNFLAVKRACKRGREANKDSDIYSRKVISQDVMRAEREARRGASVKRKKLRKKKKRERKFLEINMFGKTMVLPINLKRDKAFRKSKKVKKEIK